MITRTKVYTLVTTIVVVVLFFFFFLGKAIWNHFSMLVSEVGTSHWAIWLGGIATIGLLGLLYFTWKVLRPSNPDKPSRFEKFLDGCGEKFWENLNKILFGTAAFAIFLIFIYKEWPARFLYLKPDTYMWYWAFVAVGLALWPVEPKKFMNLFIGAYFFFLIIHVYDKWDAHGQEARHTESFTLDADSTCAHPYIPPTAPDSITWTRTNPKAEFEVTTQSRTLSYAVGQRHNADEVGTVRKLCFKETSDTTHLYVELIWK